MLPKIKGKGTLPDATGRPVLSFTERGGFRPVTALKRAALVSHSPLRSVLARNEGLEAPSNFFFLSFLAFFSLTLLYS